MTPAGNDEYPERSVKVAEIVAETAFPYEEHHLDRARTQWRFGDWESLSRIDRNSLQHHPDRAKLALMAASACAHKSQFSIARQLFRLASDWGCDRQLINRILISDVHNTLARAASVSQQKDRALRNYRDSIEVGNPGDDLSLIMEARIREQCRQLGLGDVTALLESGVITGAQSDNAMDMNHAKYQMNAIEEITQRIRSQIKEDIYKELRADNPYGHNRVLTPEMNSELRNFFRTKMGRIGLKPTYINYLAMKAVQIERNSMGRLATTIQDAVARQLIAECIDGKHIGILEIGSLYGIGLALLYNHATVYFDSVKIASIDPFDGYYGKQVDAVLNSPVNEHAFSRNMILANIPVEDYRVIRHYSTAPEALAAATEFKFNLLIIDGDHSHEGVKFDFEHYFPLLEPGGYVIIDDYNADEWPGVRKFIDEDIAGYTGVDYIGAFSRTAVLRKAA